MTRWPTITTLLTSLRAIAEPTRLRLLSLCAHGELTVNELTQILGQSQPRVSRHLKLLCDAGLLSRLRDGSSVYYRLSSEGPNTELARTIVDAIPDDDPEVTLDLARFESIRQTRTTYADNVEQWHMIRRLHVPEYEIEKILLAQLSQSKIIDLLDIGTGTGRMLELFAPYVSRAIGIDVSREMLTVARINLERAGLRHCQVRRGDMSKLPLPSASFDVVIMHQVLHYAQEPEEVVNEAARMLRYKGRLLIVDFAPHVLEYFRTKHTHHRLGFTDEEVIGWCHLAGLRTSSPIHLPGNPLTITIWSAINPSKAESALISQDST